MSEMKEVREINKWEIIESSYLLRHKYLTVRKDHIITQSGIDIPDWYVLEYPDWVNVIAVTDDGKFVIEQQYRHGIEKNGYEICAGMVEEGETPIDAAKRELLEETGYSGGEWIEYMKSSPNPSSMNNYNYSFLAKGVKRLSEPNLDAKETISVFLMTPEQVKSLLQRDMILEGIMQAPLWKYFADSNN